MNYIGTANHLSFITVICVSFFIIALSVLLNKDKNYSKLLGMSFSIPFILVIYALVNRNVILSLSLFLLAQASLQLALFIILVMKPKGQRYGLAYTLIAFLIILELSLLYTLPSFIEFITRTTVSSISVIASSLLVMLVLRKEKSTKSFLFWSTFLFLIQATLRLFESNSGIDYLYLFMNITAYYLFILYFYKEVIEKTLTKIKNAEKQLNAIDKNLNLEVRKRVLEIERSNEVLVNISKTDALTKALNKSAILDTIGNLITDAKPGTEFSLLMFDIDKFKTINDTLGHIVGDKCIKKLALIAKNSLREVDYLGRYGGDEFIIVLPDANLSHAKLVAQRFRKKVEETESPHFTVSIGISSFPQDGNTVKDLISVADDGLYHSKNKGRNAVSYKNIF